MLDTDTKRRIDTARDILVGKVPDPKSQVEQITIALIYKFMDDMDAESEELGGKRKFFTGEYARYGWAKLMDRSLGGHEMLGLYGEGISKMPENPGIPPLFRDIFKNAYLPYRDPETLKAFLKIIDEFSYDHSERLGDAFEYLLSVLGSQGDAGQFRTPRHIIDFMVDVLDPQKGDVILDPACGTAGFLISAYKHILRSNSSKPSPPAPLPAGEGRHYRGGYDFSGLKKKTREMRTDQTNAEAFLWELLRNRQLANAKFRRQHQIGDYIADFYADEAKLVVECDGEIHGTPEQQDKDRHRAAWMTSQGLHVLRFPNHRVLHETESVLAEIAAMLFTPSPVVAGASNLPSPAGRGVGGEGEVAARPGDLLTPDEKGRLAKNFRGYDISPDMVRLSLVNLYLHGFTDPHIFEYDTLTSEERWNEFADVILANPPFMSPKGGIKPHKRFSIQAKRSEVLFVDYMAEHLTPNGRAGIIVPEGIIFQSQTAYTQLRKMLVETSLVAVISLPAGVFQPYSGVKTSILILDKSLAKQAQTIAFFKVENDGFGLGAQRRAIEKNDLPKVQAELAAYLQALRSPPQNPPDQTDRSDPSAQQKDPSDPSAQQKDRSDPSNPSDRSVPSASLALVVPKAKIAANGDYNLSGERYREGTASTTTHKLVPVGRFMREGVKTVDPRNTPDELFELWSIPAFDAGRPELIRGGEIGSQKKVVAPGDVLLSRIIPHIRRGWVVQANQDGRRQVASTEWIVFSSDEVVPGFLRQLLVSDFFHASFMQTITGVGGSLSRANPAAVGEIQIPLPPLSIQKEIVAEIEGYQKVINGARAVLDNYRPHIPIHPDWPMVELGEVIEDKPKNGYSGKPVDRVTDVKVLTLSATTSGKLDLTKFKYLDEDIPQNAACRCRKGDIYLQRGNTAELVGTAALFDVNEPNFIYPDLMIRVRADEAKIATHYLLTALQSQPVREFLTRNAVGAAGSMPKINQGIVERVPIPLPPLATQQAIVAEIEAEQALVAANRELITRFEQKIQATLARIWGEEDANTSKMKQISG